MYDFDEVVSGGTLGYVLYVNLSQTSTANGKLSMGYIRKYDTSVSLPYTDWYNIGKNWSILYWIIIFEYENSKIFHD